MMHAAPMVHAAPAHSAYAQPQQQGGSRSQQDAMRNQHPPQQFQPMHQLQWFQPASF